MMTRELPLTRMLLSHLACLTRSKKHALLSNCCKLARKQIGGEGETRYVTINKTVEKFYIPIYIGF